MRIIALLSGGVDSTVALGMALADGHDCHAITFQYGQLHFARELTAAGKVAAHYGIPHRIVDLPRVFGASALTGSGDIPTGHADSPDASVVPARNLLMLSMGAAIADADSTRGLIFGANADDFAGYPDCRPAFIDALRDAVSLGTTNSVFLMAPLMHWNKGEVVEQGRAINAPLDLTWSCYRGGSKQCGRCGACQSRNEAMKNGHYLSRWTHQWRHRRRNARLA
jgi:7-cyano-7-deazaguanine synthase